MSHQITLEDYLMDRDEQFPEAECLMPNGEDLVRRVNNLLSLMVQDGVRLEVNPSSQTLITSGWRPAYINQCTPGAAPKSKHISMQACDLYDPHGELDEWCLSNQEALKDCGLWLEHPAATKGWCHLQSLPPRSGRRVFYP